MSDLCLPVEVLDHIVGNLHNSKITLRACCLVSKSWTHRIRKHLFAKVEFDSPVDLQSWKKTFPDPSTSPAHYTKHLSVVFLQSVIATDAEEHGWIPTFCHVEHFEVHAKGWISDGPPTSFVSFHEFSPALKTLFVSSAELPAIFHLAYSFPRLENLSLKSLEFDAHHDSLRLASSAPPFTGFLKLSSERGINATVNQFLSLPTGPYFRELELSWWTGEGIEPVTALVERCCSTLESLVINRLPGGTFTLHLHSD